MQKLSGRTYWLIGASEGLGRELAKRLDRDGVSLVISARSVDRLETLADELTQTPKIVPIDVTDAASVQKAAEDAWPHDGVVYLAGTYDPMRAQDWNAEKAEFIVDVNLLGAMRVLSHVVPAYTDRDAGHIMLTGSLSGYTGLPGAIGYACSKAGLMHLAEDIHVDLAGTGVTVQLANPGFIKTRLTDKNDFDMPFIMEPDKAAEIVHKALCGDRFKRDFPWHFSLVFRLARFLPRTWATRMFSG